MEGGHWRKISDILKLILPAYAIQEKEIKIKISGDGRRCGKRRQQVLISFSILNAKELSLSPDHHYSLALWEGTEDYSDFGKRLKELLTELKNFQAEGFSYIGGSCIYFYDQQSIKN